jgi:hypothetical protein
MIKLQYPFIHQAFVYIQNNLTNHFTKNQHAVCYKAFCDLILDAVSVIKKNVQYIKTLFICEFGCGIHELPPNALMAIVVLGFCRVLNCHYKEQWVYKRALMLLKISQCIKSCKKCGMNRKQGISWHNAPKYISTL